MIRAALFCYHFFLLISLAPVALPIHAMHNTKEESLVRSVSFATMAAISRWIVYEHTNFFDTSWQAIHQKRDYLKERSTLLRLRCLTLISAIGAGYYGAEYVRLLCRSDNAKASNNQVPQTQYPEIARYLPSRSIIARDCANRSDDYYCKRMNQFLWCAANEPDEHTYKQAKSNLLSGKTETTDYTTIAAYTFCKGTDLRWDLLENDSWNIRYHPREKLKGLHYSAMHQEREANGFITTLQELRKKRVASFENKEL